MRKIKPKAREAYMKKPLKLPKFKNEDKEREFWAKINLADYFEPSDFKPVSFPNLKPTTRAISIRLPEYLIDRIAEEAFLDEKAIIVIDIKHSQKEKRFTLIGETVAKKLLFVVFTLRDKKVRIISARKANRKEKNKYA